MVKNKMDRENFIEGIKKKRDYAAEGVEENLKSPPGRKPRIRDVHLSKFYHSLTEEQKNNLQEVIKESIDMGLFSFLCVLDHVSFLEDTPEKTQFELYAVKNGERILLNDFSQEDLHDLYNGLVQEVD